jgi:hypothetical protein
MRLSFVVFSAAAFLVLGIQAEAHARGGIAGARGGAAAGSRGAAVGGARGGSYTTNRGTTVQAGRAGGVATGPLGGVHAGGVQGARVTTASGKTVTTGSRGGATVGPAGGVHAHGSRGTAVSGPGGAAAVRRSGGVAVGPYGGVAVGGSRVAVGHATRYVSPTALRTQAVYVRGGAHYAYFTPTWHRAHPGCWVPARWAVANYWVAPVWRSLAAWCAITAAPVVYDYGSGLVIDNNYVYDNGDQVATAEEYYDQAAQFADQGREAKPPEEAEWQPLGVFGMIQGDEQVAQNIFQLAVDKEGTVRGNYYDAVSDSTLPVYGSVDKKSQRVAWSIGDKKTVVFEAGLSNLADEQTTILVHYGKERTQQMVLVRLEEPKEEKK